MFFDKFTVSREYEKSKICIAVYAVLVKKLVKLD